MTELVRGLTPEQLQARTPACPDWTVREVLSHLTGVTADVAAHRLEGAGQPSWSAAQVAARQDKGVDELVAEWEQHAPAVESQLDDWGQFGWILVWDVTMHDDDIRESAGLPFGASPTHTAVLDGLVARAGKTLTEAGLPALAITAGERSWTAGEGEPAMSLAASDEGELARVLGGRRSHDRMRAMAWTGDPEPYLPHLTLFPPGG
ncbi:MAG: maleylpyruvate isomerase family mycothiol-dependent enzyme [Frankiaceae bacterium]|nr:maleylpyruvate isomerase family mycothiol-dependent enzyme [Frankiaceae bacterium]